MRYANKEKTLVSLSDSETGKGWTVPRGHRLWFKWGIDEAEENGEILPSLEEEE